MKQKVNAGSAENTQLKAEFDLLADEYHSLHKTNIAITGELPEYFAEYKIVDLAAIVRSHDLKPLSIFDFGSGIGNSIPYFRKYFPESVLHCGDVSARSFEISRTRFPGEERYTLIGEEIPLPDNSQDVVFSACVFHHIPHEQHQHWLSELHRITKPNGMLTIFEHNPKNPLTVRAVNTCPLDVNARLIHAEAMRDIANSSGWLETQIVYRLFFPSVLRALRGLEIHLGWLPIGAQYRMSALKSI